jgi:hypothetical protein
LTHRVDANSAVDWYDVVYSPAIRAIERDRLGGRYRDAPDAVLFLLLHRRRREGFPSCGCPPLEETFTTVAAEAAGKAPRHHPVSPPLTALGERAGFHPDL